MPSNAKRRKSAKKKKKRRINIDSPTNSQENGDKDDDLISHDEKEYETSEENRDFPIQSGIEKASMDGSENGGGESKQKIETKEGSSLSNPDSESKVGKGSNGDSSGERESSESSSDEESRTIVNLSETGGTPVGIVDPIERLVSVTEEVKLVADATRYDMPEVTRAIDDAPVENLEVAKVIEIDIDENSGVAQITEATVVENTGVVGAVDSPSVETKEKITQLSSETVSEKPIDTELPVSGGNEEPQIVSALPPVRRTSWKGCCGLFELFTGSHR